MAIELQGALRRAQIEVHIERCRAAAEENVMEVGRWLLAAKEEGVVPHGEWAAWVETHAGMSERGAQRLMQAARQLPPGSKIQHLGIAKISALLALPADIREQAAQDMDAAHISSREVADKVRAIRAERDEALRLIGEQKRRLADADTAREAAVRSATAAAQQEQRRSEARAAELSGQLAAAVRERDDAQAAIDRLQARLAAAQAQTREDPAARARIAQLERELDTMSEQLDEAQTALMRGAMAEPERVSPATRILSSIGGLMTQAGQAPGELSRMVGLDEETRAILCGQAQMIGRWAMSIIAACGGEMDG